MESLLLDVLTLYPTAVYISIFFLMIIEGEMALLAAALLAYQGYLDWRILLVVSTIGTFIGDNLWYRLGLRLGHRWPRLSAWVGRVAGPIDTIIRRRPGIAVFGSKFVYGLNHATLTRVGMVATPWPKFLRGAVAVALIWNAFIVGLAFLLNESIGYLGRYLKYSEIILLSGVVLGVIISRLISFRVSRHLQKIDQADRASGIAIKQ